MELRLEAPNPPDRLLMPGLDPRAPPDAGLEEDFGAEDPPKRMEPPEERGRAGFGAGVDVLQMLRPELLPKKEWDFTGGMGGMGGMDREGAGGDETGGTDEEPDAGG